MDLAIFMDAVECYNLQPWRPKVEVGVSFVRIIFTVSVSFVLMILISVVQLEIYKQRLYTERIIQTALYTTRRYSPPALHGLT